MSYREKIMVFTCGLIICLSLFYFAMLVPAQDKTKKLTRMIAQREKDIIDIKRLKEKLMKIRKKYQTIENKLNSIENDFSPFTFLETVAQKSKLRDKITSINPQMPIDAGEYKGTTLEIKINKASLSEIVEYLYRIENSNYWIKINKLVLKTEYGETNKFNARLTIASFSRT